jgi:transcription initiation factor TFIIIB Brf1 subunit/transcription initiation factor TFIIB
MAIRDIYERAFDEDVQTDAESNQCPECDGRVTTNAVETVCEECGLVINEQRIDHGPEWRPYDNDERKRTGGPLTAARHDRGLSTEIRQRARTLAEEAEERGVTSGVHPAGFAAACLYKAAREDGRWLTQTEAADVANASTGTVRTHRDTLEEHVA